MKYRAVLLVCFVLFSLFTLAVSASEPLPERGICAHRGWNSAYPENTVPAFEAAVKMGAQMIEFDVRFTKDRQLVLMHDWTVDRTSNGKGNILNLTFDEVRALDFGGWKSPEFAGTQIPTLDEALAVIPRNIWLNIHLDAPAEVAEELGLAVADKIVADGRTDQAFLACGHKAADAVKAKYPQFLICNMHRQGGNVAYINDTIERGCAFIQLTDGVPTPEQTKRLHDAGIRINYFGTNDPDEMKRLFDAGVDFPLVDKLDLGMEFFSKY